MSGVRVNRAAIGVALAFWVACSDATTPSYGAGAPMPAPGGAPMMAPAVPVAGVGGGPVSPVVPVQMPSAGSAAGPGPMASGGAAAQPGAPGVPPTTPGNPPAPAEPGVGEAPVACPASKAPPGDSNEVADVGGMMRDYILHVPASYDGTKPVALMINFHPLIFGTSSGQRTGSGWAAIGDREGIITAFPNGIGAAWDIGNCCTPGDVDDMGFAMKMVEDISKKTCIDPKRIYASGYSMGGGMSHLLACKAADTFAAVGPSAFDLTQENHMPCEPTRPVTVIMYRGMGDGVVPWGGGPTTPPNGTPVTVTMLGAEGTFKEWAKINECPGEPVAATGPMESNCRIYTGCKQDTEVMLCENGGHTQGSAEVTWNHLKNHTLR